MLKRLFTSALFVLVLALVTGMGGCASSKETDALPGSAVPNASPVNTGVVYNDGFYGQEGSGANTFRWMGKEGNIKFKNSKSDMKLTLVCGVPTDFEAKKPVVKLIFNGEQLDQFTPAPNTTKEYSIAVTRQGTK